VATATSAVGGDLGDQLAERSLDFPGVQVTVVPRREYPYGTLACHILGQVKRWAKGDVPDEYKRSRGRMHYQGEDSGIAGVEYTMNSKLRGEEGRQIFVRNEKNKIIAIDDYSPPQQGATVELTIDSRMQYLVENIMRRVGRGAAVVMDPNNGEILAMASVPNFDPNDFVPAITQKKWAAYNSNRANPFLNRALNSYTPGSTFKLPTAIAGCIHGKTGFHHNCIGHSAYGTLKIGCWKDGGHGTLGLSESIQRSCNPYFMSLANDLGTDIMVDTFGLLGLGRKTGINLPNEDPGIVPGNKVWRRELRPGKTLEPAALGMTSIGQSDAMATPLQLCAIGATIANGGSYYQPRIVRRVIENDDRISSDNIPVVKMNLLKKRLEVIRKGMWLAVNQRGGTAQRVALKGIFAAAKTGTAQTGQPEEGDKNNAWTVSFAPYDSPKFAICVMVRNGRSGGKVAGVLTNQILRGLFAIDSGYQFRLTKMGIYEGNFDAFEEIESPEGEIFALDIDDAGETGNEFDPALLKKGEPIKVTPKKIILPSIAPLPDATETPGDTNTTQ